MCGIAGAYQQVDGELLTRVMSDRLAHRGPDASGLRTVDAGRARVSLAQRRLSIIDLSSAADQPFSKGGLTIVYNGEVYNYREIREELVAKGHTFTTSSDTEVVLEAWRCWGPAALARFRGMFAFGLLDERTGQLFLARDPLGIKPLHYIRRAGGLLFASELKALVQAIGSELSVDAESIVASMLYYWIPDERTCFTDVERLSPGSWAEILPDGSFREERYWEARAVAEEAIEGPRADLRKVIEDSVAAHLVADVPISTFLSGGLDSSIITVLAQRTNPDIDAYTIKFRPEDYRREAMPDDALYARRLAAQFGIPLREIEIAPDVADLLPRMVDMLDEPVGDPAAINTFLMCEAARDAGVKVLLSGMGADELFGGYRKHLACAMAAHYRRAPGALRSGTSAAVSRLPVTIGGRGIRGARWAQRFVTFASLPEESAFRRSYTLYDPEELEALLHPALAGEVNNVVKRHTEIYEDTTLTDHVNRMCLADSRMFMTGLNLAYTDRASMAASTEVRTPFVDREVFRAAFTFSGQQKIRGGKGKVALKNAARAWLPDDIIDRPKASFSAPLRAWVSYDLRELIDDTLMRGELVGGGLIDAGGLQRMVTADRQGRADYSKQIWQLLTLEQWYRNARAQGVSTSAVDPTAFTARAS